MENSFGAFSVKVVVRGRDEEVIHVNDKPSFGNHVSERVIHESLEGGGGVAQAEEHYGGFEQSFVGDKGCFPLVSISDADVVVSPSDVKFGEDLGVFYLIDEILD